MKGPVDINIPDRPLLARPLEPALATEMVEKGLPWREVALLVEHFEMTSAEFAKVVGIPQRTILSRKRRRRLSVQESDRVMRFARLWVLAIGVFEGEDGARAWLKQPALGLRGRIPLEVAGTECGAYQVETLLQRIDFGLP